MKSVEKVAAFSAYAPILHIFRIFDLDNFRNKELLILIHNIGQAIAFAIIALAFIVAIVCDVWYCMDHKFTEHALPFALLINFPQLAVTYTSIRLNINLVDEVIVKLKQVIRKRKYTSLSLCYCVQLTHTHTLNF